MILSDKSIKELIKSGKLVITPFDEDLVQPSSYNLRLANAFRVYRNTKHAFLDSKEPMADFMELLKTENGDPIIIHPNEFILGESLESLEIPDNLVGVIEGRTSLAKMGIGITKAEHVAPGYKGTLTFQITNSSNIPIALYPKMGIAQISFLQMTTPAEFPYGSRKLGSKYQGQHGPAESRLFREFVREVKKITKKK